VKARFGKVPNGIQVLGTSEETLRGYLGFADAASRGRLRGAERERIAIAVATFNGCDYCLAGRGVQGRRGRSPRGAALPFRRRAR
jgi:AhpD family alkylhydroperoxidase